MKYLVIFRRRCGFVLLWRSCLLFSIFLSGQMSTTWIGNLIQRFVWLSEQSIIFVVCIFNFFINHSFLLSWVWPDPSSSKKALFCFFSDSKSKNTFSLIKKTIQSLLEILSIYFKFQRNQWAGFHTMLVDLLQIDKIGNLLKLLVSKFRIQLNLMKWNISESDRGWVGKPGTVFYVIEELTCFL